MTPEQDARFTKALEGIPAAVSSALAREMKGLVTRDGAGNEVRMADVAIGTVGQALGLLVLRSSFEWQRDDALATTLREASTRLGELTTVVNRLSAGAGGPVDLSPILTELHALRTQLNQLTLTAAPGHVST